MEEDPARPAVLARARAQEKSPRYFPSSSSSLSSSRAATGNLATEDLVWLLNGLGIEHGVDLDALVATSAWMAEQLGRPSPSAVVRALSQSPA